MPAAGVVDVAGVVPGPAALAGGLAAGVRDQEGRVGLTPATVGPVQVGVTATALELQQQVTGDNTMTRSCCAPAPAPASPSA